LEPAKTIDIQPWMTAADTSAVMGALATLDREGPAALFVGGCVRDTLMGRDVVDIDIATAHTPDEVVRRLEAAGIGYHTIGIDHGTVAAHGEDRLLEITTLRVDVETHGRHATVAYTDDWSADAARRDFTINALYMDMDGRVFDPLGGMADVDARRVRFIGDASERIHEDALRILRFFRFHAQLDVSVLDPDGLAACRANAALLDNLSGERIRDELFKFLAGPNARDVLGLSSVADVIQKVLPEVARKDAGYWWFEIATIENEHSEPDPLRRLVALIEFYPWRTDEYRDSPGIGARAGSEAIRDDIASVVSRLCLSGRQAARLNDMVVRPRDLAPIGTPATTEEKLEVISLYRSSFGVRRGLPPEAKVIGSEEPGPEEWSHSDALLPMPKIWKLRRLWSRKKQQPEVKTTPEEMRRDVLNAMSEGSFAEYVRQHLRENYPEQMQRIRRHLYELNDEQWRDAVFLNWADFNTDVIETSAVVGGLDFSPDNDWLDLLELPNVVPRPVFPLRGQDVLDLGVPQGPEISRLLGEVEQWWIDGGFVADRKACLAELKRRAGKAR